MYFQRQELFKGRKSYPFVACSLTDANKTSFLGTRCEHLNDASFEVNDRIFFLVVLTKSQEYQTGS
jgi:hypothetical protein